MKNIFTKVFISMCFIIILINYTLIAKTYYSIDNGAWSEVANWSTESYNGTKATEFPSGGDTIKIGNSKAIELDGDFIVNNPGMILIENYGVLNCGMKILSGTGTFVMDRDANLGIGDANCITQEEALGNIQTTIRLYNGFDKHNSSSFIFTGKNQTISLNSGLPKYLKQIIVNLSSIDSKLTFNCSIETISKCLDLKRGKLSLNADWNFGGNAELLVSDIAEFIPNTSSISFSGIGNNTISSTSTKPINIYNLKLNKPEKSGNLNLGTSTSIYILNKLSFSDVSGYKSFINCRTNYQSFIQLDKNASIINSTNKTGWINGELRKYCGDETENRYVIFEIGDSSSYSPMTITFFKGENGGDGYLSALVIKKEHQFLDRKYNISIDPDRVIGPKWWRLMNPRGSLFNRGDRSLNIKFQYSLYDGAEVDYFGCTDISYIRSWSEKVDWQALYPINLISNDGSTGCSDTRSKNHSENFTYFGEESEGLFSTEVRNISSKTIFGSSEFIEDNLLLGDFVIGNQFNITDVNDNYSDINFEIMPNPASNYLKILNTNSDSHHYQIYSLEGILQIESKNNDTINVSNLSTGIYILKSGDIIRKFAKI